ncbi:hypothetical protein TPY_0572 [Sulfobacillus acidophilus TPY]|uniref:Uncharacterized protein n=1 Tax=Sulfobacillus acidophilus (strain ATCC 700253 / DSM 10332 / NAL) TaxID=679936 RepID=G8U0X7_SULAD|nr:hypothetical protein TPY_0572 [Sulfobacillus acidophilus TPY]AEW06522.1 hypothetical protein Sulac_3065 [Sulfobacillus acidophilus DSM 10332]
MAYGNPQFRWFRGFLFGDVLAALGALVVKTKCKAPTMEQMKAAVAKVHGPDAVSSHTTVS